MSDNALAVSLLAVDPAGLGGAVLKGAAGPARDAWLAALRASFPPTTPWRRLPARIEEARLLGGLDFAASLTAGRPVLQTGLLAEAHRGAVVAPMAERLSVTTTSALCASLDAGEIRLEREGLAASLPARVLILALDEGLEDEACPAALADRLAFHIALAPDEPRPDPIPAAEVSAARARLATLAPAPADLVAALCATALRLGVGSLRAPVLAMKAMQAHAALAGRRLAEEADAAAAARLVLGPRATVLPAEAADEAPPPEPPPPEPPANEAPSDDDPAARDDQDLSELLIAAVRAALPEGVLEALTQAGAAPRIAAGRGAGAQTRSSQRGRPSGVRQGRPGGGARLNLVETLRAAAPWQRLRRGEGAAAGAPTGAVAVRPSDFRIQTFVQRRESTTIFAVDASGSTALQRLGEAKGAVELLLAKAYSTRARVALIAFRGLEAELLLPPTRALARARARLASLPGGGGTPLASAMDAALRLALAEAKRGATPRIVLLTDGKANVARGGVAGRAAAEADAQAAAQAIGAARIASVFIDTAPRPAPDADRFARAMGGAYRHLPYADAGALAGAVMAERPAAAPGRT